jgi:hypothetical protein
MGLMEYSTVPGPINLGNPEEMTVLEIAERVIRQVGSGCLVHRPLPEDDPHRRKPDITAARETFGFSPSTPFDEGLRATIAYFRERVGQVESQGIASNVGWEPRRLNGVNLPALARPTQFSYRLPVEGVNLSELERNVLAQALRHTSGDPGKAAALLGLTDDQIRHRMAKLGMDTQ